MDRLNRIIEKYNRIIIIILLLFISFCLFEISKNGRYQVVISNERPTLIIDTRNGKTYIPIRGKNPKPFSFEIK